MKYILIVVYDIKQQNIDKNKFIHFGTYSLPSYIKFEQMHVLLYIQKFNVFS